MRGRRRGALPGGRIPKAKTGGSLPVARWIASIKRLNVVV